MKISKANLPSEYGQVEETVNIGGNVSATTTRIFQKNVEIENRLRFTERYRVTSAEQGSQKLSEIVRRIKDTEGIIDPVVDIPKMQLLNARGYYDIVLSDSLQTKEVDRNN